MTTLAAETLLGPVRQVGGFAHAGLVDASTGMVLGSVQAAGGLAMPPVAAAAADLAGVLSQMAGEFSEAEDVIVTLGRYYVLIRLLAAGPGRRLILLLTLDRSQANLAMAHRELRDFAAALVRDQQWPA